MDEKAARKMILQKEFGLAIQKTEVRIINKAVAKYKDNLNAQEALSIIASIAAMRMAVSEIG